MLASIEVSTRVSSVALWDLKTGQEKAELLLSSDKESSVTLLPGLKTLLESNGLAGKDITAVAVALGPGSFTGIRIGIATAEGLAMPSHLPVFGISTLDGLAENLRMAGHWGSALCLIDAGRGECFVGQYLIEKENFRETTAPAILKIEALKDLIRDKAWVIGAGFLKYEKEIKESLGTKGQWVEAGLHDPKASSIARLAYHQWQAGLRPGLETLKPLYLRIPSVDEKKP
ncbi:MAG TPA: tRNA (adenosine(37)-N6)-threonylcarbamoyltransferase complex dimerization subunit type 1 TsaB [bacterium]|nr:tRNA (adenosine(37)-N6)-threonylcarbamoyltransferase complex dimerization subunit type 1 TsaB [bacterium]